MIGVERLPITPDQRRGLPLALRIIYFKELPTAPDQAEPYRITEQGAVAATTIAFEKPVSRI